VHRRKVRPGCRAEDRYAAPPGVTGAVCRHRRLPGGGLVTCTGERRGVRLYCCSSAVRTQLAYRSPMLDRSSDPAWETGPTGGSTVFVFLESRAVGSAPGWVGIRVAGAQCKFNRVGRGRSGDLDVLCPCWDGFSRVNRGIVWDLLMLVKHHGWPGDGLVSGADLRRFIDGGRPGPEAFPWPWVTASTGSVASDHEHWALDVGKPRERDVGRCPGRGHGCRLFGQVRRVSGYLLLDQADGLDQLGVRPTAPRWATAL